jgi:transcriptional regulator with XRE-family HTH domain
MEVQEMHSDDTTITQSTAETGVQDADRHTGNEGVGSVVRRLRQEKGMTLKELAAASGVSVGMLSQIERKLANPSVRVLTGIRRALDAPVSVLFEEAERPQIDHSFVRRVGKRPILDLGEMRKELITHSGAHNTQIMILHIDPGASSGGQISYSAEKGGLVLSGEIELTVNNETALLRAGDGFAFDSALPHGFSNCGEETARVLWIIGSVQLDRHL